MYNPFPLFTPTLLLAQMSEAKGKRFFVRQTFPRGKMPELKAAFLFPGYTEEEKDLAEEHFQNLHRDPNAFFYDAKNPEHLEKLKTAARQPSGYKIYYVGKTKWEWKPPPVYQNKMKNFIQKMHPRWRTSRGKNKVMVGLYEERGELFLKFNFEEEEDKIVFDEIENF
jgi:hypothetical protein